MMNTTLENTLLSNKKAICPKCKEVETRFVEPPKSSNITFIAKIPETCKSCYEKQEEIIKKENYKINQQFLISRKDKVLNFSSIGTKYKNSNFEQLDKSIEGFELPLIWAKRFNDRILNGGEKISVYLYGTTGNGKTEIQACAYNELVKNNKNCLLTTLGKLFEVMHDYQKTKTSDVFSVIKSLDALFIDDFGSETLDKRSKGWLFEIFDILDKNEIPLFITSNFFQPKHWNDGDKQSIESISIQRVFSRLLGKSNFVENSAKDYRVFQAKSRR
jgi:DNA replication protein DnaC